MGLRHGLVSEIRIYEMHRVDEDYRLPVTELCPDGFEVWVATSGLKRIDNNSTGSYIGYLDIGETPSPRTGQCRPLACATFGSYRVTILYDSR